MSGDLVPARLHHHIAAALVASTLAGQLARADTHGVFRVGVEPISLDPSSETPYVGGYVNEAITAYNAASSAYNRAHGLAASSPMAATPIDAGDLGLHATLLTFAPGLEVGGERWKFRVEGLLGVSDHVRALGAGVYPLDFSLPLRDSTIVPYAVAGGTLRWLSRSDTDGEVGGLATLRAAVGARFGRRIVAEVGCSLYMLGGLYNRGQLDAMTKYDPRGSAPPPAPDRAVSGGTQSGMIDFSVGFSL